MRPDNKANYWLIKVGKWSWAKQKNNINIHGDSRFKIPKLF